MKRKYLTVLLCACMLLSALPVTVAAAGDTPVLRISGTGIELDQDYNDLFTGVAAYLAAVGGEGGITITGDCTMELLADVEITLTEDIGFGIVIAGTSTLDLGGHTLTVKGSGMAILTSGDVCVKNGTIILNDSGLMGIVNGEDKLTVENVEITAGEGVSGVVGIVNNLEENGRNAGTTIKNSRVVLGGDNTDITDIKQTPVSSPSYQVVIESGQFTKNPETSTGNPIVIADNSKELSNAAELGAEGAVIASQSTAGLIVDQGKARLYDSLADGTVVTGSSTEAPAVNADGTVGVPAGGSVGGHTYVSGGTVQQSGVAQTPALLPEDTAPAYAVTAPAAVNGSVTVTPKRAGKGDTVTIIIRPNEGYELDGLTVTDGKGEELQLTKIDENRYTFKMPGSKVKIKAGFTEAAAEPAALPFTDVPAGSWYGDAVRFFYENGMMAGINATAFGPDVATTRGMIVTILYRLEGEPEAGVCDFDDVTAGQHYSNAVAWAAANGIVSGYVNGAFGPDDIITREQLAVILYRYA